MSYNLTPPGGENDVLNYASLASFPATGQSGIIYLAEDSNTLYRWDGATYVAVGDGGGGGSLVLGETSTTAHRGDHGKIAHDHSQATGNPHGTTPAQITGFDAAVSGNAAVAANTAKRSYPQADQDKLVTIEANAKDDQTGAEIKALYEGETNTNAFTDAEKSKLAGLESSKFLGTYLNLTALQTAHPDPVVGSYAHVDAGIGAEVSVYVWDDDDAQYVQQAGSGTEETAASIKTKYESNPDTNAFQDAEKAKVANVPANTVSELAGKSNTGHGHNASEVTEEAEKLFMTSAERSKVGNVPADTNAELAKNPFNYRGTYNITALPVVPSGAVGDMWKIITSDGEPGEMVDIFEWWEHDSYVVKTGTGWVKLFPSAVSEFEYFFTATSGEAFADRDIIYRDPATEKWFKARANSEATSGPVELAIALGAATAADEAIAVQTAFVVSGFPVLMTEGPVYLDDAVAGKMRFTPPTASGSVIRRIGYARDQFYLKIDIDVGYELADDRAKLDNLAADAEATYEAAANKGAANGYAPLGADQKVPTANLPDAILGALSYQGVWNASTNTPTIPAAASGNKGYYYKVSVAGSTNIDGTTDWQPGDWIVSSGTVWDKVDNSEVVSSVANKTGAVTLDANDVAEVTDKRWLTDAERTKVGNVPANTNTELAAKASLTGAETLTNKTLTSPNIDHTKRTEAGTTGNVAATDQQLFTSNDAAVALTVPTGLTRDFVIIQNGAGAVTVTGATGVILNGVNAGSVTSQGQYYAMAFIKDPAAADTFTVVGDSRA